jgi:hypothetical protein
MQVFMARHTENTACLQFLGQWNLQGIKVARKTSVRRAQNYDVARWKQHFTPTQTHNVKIKESNLALVPAFRWIYISPPRQIGIVVFVE